MLVVSFTGHRPDKLGGYTFPNPQAMWVIEHLYYVLDKLQPDKVITGMALGVDQWAAEVSIDLDIPFVAAIPFPGQDRTWPEESKEKYKTLLDYADEVNYLYEGGYAAWKMQARNQWMVDNSDLVIAVWDGSEGGTSNCVKYATKQKKQIIRIDPRNFLTPTTEVVLR